jgi:hypothetical protein
MKMRKEPLLAHRIRRPPKEGWSWIDRRFLRDHAPALERDAVFLYFFLAAVSDKYGLSFYGEPAIGAQLRVAGPAVARARDELAGRDLIAYRRPLYQVLSLPPPVGASRSSAEPGALSDILRSLVQTRFQQTPPERRIIE